MTDPADTIREALKLDESFPGANAGPLAALTELEQLASFKVEANVSYVALRERAEAAEADRDRLQEDYAVEIAAAAAVYRQREKELAGCSLLPQEEVDYRVSLVIEARASLDDALARVDAALATPDTPQAVTLASGNEFLGTPDTPPDA